MAEKHSSSSPAAPPNEIERVKAGLNKSASFFDAGGHFASETKHKDSPKIDDTSKSGSATPGSAKAKDDSDRFVKTDGQEDLMERRHSVDLQRPRAESTGLVSPPFRSNFEFEYSKENEEKAEAVLAAAAVAAAEANAVKAAAEAKAKQSEEESSELKPQRRDMPGFFAARSRAGSRSRKQSESSQVGKASGSSGEGGQEKRTEDGEDNTRRPRRRRRRSRGQSDAMHPDNFIQDPFYQEPYWQQASPRSPQYRGYRMGYPPQYAHQQQGYVGYNQQGRGKKSYNQGQGHLNGAGGRFYPDQYSGNYHPQQPSLRPFYDDFVTDFAGMRVQEPLQRNNRNRRGNGNAEGVQQQQQQQQQQASRPRRNSRSGRSVKIQVEPLVIA